MAVFRVQKTQNYTIMSNHHLNDKALSLKAKGLLSLMLSLPDRLGLYHARAGVHLQRGRGQRVCHRARARKRPGTSSAAASATKNGQVRGMEYTVFRAAAATGTGKSRSRLTPERVPKPKQAEPAQEKPAQENPAQLNTKETNNENSK